MKHKVYNIVDLYLLKNELNADLGFAVCVFIRLSFIRIGYLSFKEYPNLLFSAKDESSVFTVKSKL